MAGHKLYLDNTRYKYTVTLAAVPKNDQNSKQKFTKDGAPMWQTEVQAFNPTTGATILTVTTAGIKPTVISGEAVTPVGLEAIPWNQNGKNGVVYRAEELKPVAVPAGK